MQSALSRRKIKQKREIQRTVIFRGVSHKEVVSPVVLIKPNRDRVHVPPPMGRRRCHRATSLAVPRSDRGKTGSFGLRYPIGCNSSTVLGCVRLHRRAARHCPMCTAFVRGRWVNDRSKNEEKRVGLLPLVWKHAVCRFLCRDATLSAGHVRCKHWRLFATKGVVSHPRMLKISQSVRSFSLECCGRSELASCR